MIRNSFIGILGMLVGPACVHLPEAHPVPPVEVPEAYSEAGADSAEQPSVSEAWWRAFDDPELSRLIDESLQGSFQLQEAWARLDQVHAMSVQASSGLWPTLGIDVQGTRSARPFSIPTATGGTVATTLDSRSYSASVGASYEIDLWGKMRSRRSAALLDLQATRADLETIATTVAAQVAETWFALVAARAQLAILEEQRTTNRQFLELIELRFEQGQASGVDVLQQRQQVAASTAQIESIQGQRRTLEKQLSVLVGRSPGDTASGPGAALPSLPPLPATGLPGELLSRRPDVRAAQLRVGAADHRVGVALADMFPSLRLTASYGFGATALVDVIGSTVWSLLGSITQPLFEGGRRKAEWNRAEAALNERVHAFGRVLVNAMLEVEVALVQEQQQKRHLAALSEQVQLAEAALEESKARYLQGLDSFLRVLTSTQALQRLQQSEVNAERQLLSYRVQMLRALGGPWSTQLQHPTEQTKTSGESS